MKIEIESTENILQLDGVPCRVWEGKLEDGSPCYVYVHLVAVRGDYPQEQYAKELKAQLEPFEVKEL